MSERRVMVAVSEWLGPCLGRRGRDRLRPGRGRDKARPALGAHAIWKAALGAAVALSCAASGQDAVEWARRVSLAGTGGLSAADASGERVAANEAMNELRRVAAEGDGVPETFRAVALDEGRDGGVREYAVQHLGAWGRSGRERAKAEAMLWELAEDPVAGTAAVLQLHHAGGPSLKGRPAWTELLERRMARPDLRDAEKATLLAVAAESGVREALPRAKEWAADAESVVLLRCALQAVGQLGGLGDVAFLDALAEEKELGGARGTWENARRRLTEGTEP